jgi:hypothetical protein
MRSGRGGKSAARLAALAVIVLACSGGQGLGAEPVVETVFFTDPLRGPVKVVRGGAAARPPTQHWGRTEIVNFGDDRRPVTVVHGGVKANASHPAEPPPQTRFETVGFADPALSAVTIVRGVAAPRNLAAIDLFDLKGAGELDRIAFAVDGVESRHGADLRMWRPEPLGPQGPMQISAAAAFDVGGGDRFDLHQNRQLGRAYLAQMYRRYGNWGDALAAYNWGPGNLDLWIAAGRSAERLPLETMRYVSRVLRDAMVSLTQRW